MQQQQQTVSSIQKTAQNHEKFCNNTSCQISNMSISKEKIQKEILVPQSELDKYSSNTVKHIRNNSWGFARPQIGVTNILDVNKGVSDYFQEKTSNKTANSQTLKPPRSDSSYSEVTVTQYFNKREQYFAEKAAYGITEDIEEESESPLKPNPTVFARRGSKINPYCRPMRKFEEKPDLTFTQMSSDLDSKVHISISTGVSGSESTPSNNQKHNELSDAANLISLESTTQASEFESGSMRMHKTMSKEGKLELDALSQADLSTQSELENFNPILETCVIDNDTIEFLIQREKIYAPDPWYLKTKQPNVSWQMRAILADWMLEVSTEFTLKRETYHYALSYVDRFLSIFSNVQKQELQLVGVAALFIAAKCEEIYSFRVDDFAKACDNAYTVEQIIQTESMILRKLRWMLVPPTLTTWTQWYLSQWDLYIEKASHASAHPLIVSLGNEAIVQFRQPHERSYMLFREIMQYIDCITLDVEHLQYNMRTVIAGLMYLVIGKVYKQFALKQITVEFSSNNSSYLLNKQSQYNDFFAKFLEFTFGLQLEDLLASVQYIAPFFKLPLDFELPRAVQLKKGIDVTIKL